MHLWTKEANVFAHTVPNDVIVGGGDVGSGGDSGSAEGNTTFIDGYSIDLTRRVLANLGLGVTPTYVHMLNSNAEVLGQNGTGHGLASDVCDPSLTPHALCLGAAALSITAEREALYDFTATYYTSTLRILAPAPPSPARAVAARIAEVLLGALLVCVFFLCMMAPMLWASEMLLTQWSTVAKLAEAGRMPIFSPGADDADRVLITSAIAACWYTVRSFLGARLQPPNSRFASRVLVPALTEFRGLVALVTTAALAANFARDAATSGSDVRAIADLAGRAVCTNTDAAFVHSVVTELAAAHGFRVLEHPDFSSTFDAYFDSECDALIYDDAVARAELRARRNSYTPSHRGYARVQSSAIVGEPLSWSPFGIAMRTAHPLRKEVNLAILALSANRRVRADLEAKWLTVPRPYEAPADDRAFGRYLGAWGTPLSVAAVLVFLIGAGAVAALAKIRARLLQAARQPASDRGLELMRARHANIAPADVALKSTAALVVEMATAIRAIDQNVHRMASEQSQVLTVVANTKKMPTLLVQNV